MDNNEIFRLGLPNAPAGDPDTSSPEKKVALAALTARKEFYCSLGLSAAQAANLALRFPDIDLSHDTQSVIRAAVSAFAPPASQVHGGHRDRLRASFLSGEDLRSFSDIEILEALLAFIIPRKDTNPTAHLLLDRFGSLIAVLAAAPSQLLNIGVMTRDAAALLPLLGVCALWRGDKHITLLNRNDTVNFFGSIFLGGNASGDYVTFLDKNSVVIAVLPIDVSDYRALFGAICKYNASEVLVAVKRFNLFPMKYDLISDVDRLSSALPAIGAHLLDFIFFCDFGYYAVDLSADLNSVFVFNPLVRIADSSDLLVNLFFPKNDLFSF